MKGPTPFFYAMTTIVDLARTLIVMETRALAAEAEVRYLRATLNEGAITQKIIYVNGYIDEINRCIRSLEQKFGQMGYSLDQPRSELEKVIRDTLVSISMDALRLVEFLEDRIMSLGYHPINNGLDGRPARYRQ
jgi:hypothetical protein